MLGIVEPPPARLVGRRQPARAARADHRLQHVALRHLRPQHVNIVVAGLDVALDVDEQGVAPQFLLQPVEQPPSGARIVAPPVVDEDAARHDLPRTVSRSSFG